MGSKLEIDQAKQILSEIAFPSKYITDTTAICVCALYDEAPRFNLINGYTKLSQGARVTDILEFSDKELGKKYAENSRETFRKYSLKYLVDEGLAIKNPDKPTRATNSGLNNYILSPQFKQLIDAYLQDTGQFNELKIHFSNVVALARQEEIEKLQEHRIHVEIPQSNDEVSLSPGEHNIIEKFIVEEIMPSLFPNFQLVYIGDTQVKDHFDEELCRKINLTVDVHNKIPDVIGFDSQSSTILLFEAVASSGPIDNLRKKELLELFDSNQFNLVFGTVFLYDKLFQSFSKLIADGTDAYIIESRRKISYTTY
jgi:type II restriction enzyme